VTQVTPDSPAARAGIRVGDRLLEFAGQPLLDDQQFAGLVLAAPADVSVLVDRKGAQEPLKLAIRLAGSPARLGIGWREDDAEAGTVVLTQVLTGSPAQRGGLRLGDRLYEEESRIEKCCRVRRLFLLRKGILSCATCVRYGVENS
jgi:S1-C subfamily serine protease